MDVCGWYTQLLHCRSPAAGENAGCFGGKKRRDGAPGSALDGSLPSGGTPTAAGTGPRRHAPVKGMELLWQPDVSTAAVARFTDGAEW